MMSFDKSESMFERARKVIPGGVNSPVRAFRGVGGHPLFFVEGDGAYVVDADDNRFIDYVGSWGPMILGHKPPAIKHAVQQQAERSLGFGAPTLLEVELAEKIVALVPSIEQVRLVSSGTEATMSAIRLARGITGRDLIVKFDGCYHGHADSLLVKAGSGVLTLGIPGSPGIPHGIASLTLSLTFNAIDEVERAFAAHGERIAAIIVEPIAGNMNCVLPKPEFLTALRHVCDRYGSLLIFDEVITGFRVGLSGAQGLFGITPDLTTLGKIIGGGLPVGAYGGPAKHMQHIAPTGPVYQAGTLSGNPVTVAAGLAALAELQRTDFYSTLEARTQRLAEGIEKLSVTHSVPMKVVHVCGMLGIYFIDPAAPIHNYEDVTKANAERYKAFFHALLQRGVYLAPSAFEVAFVSASHTESIIDTTLDAMAQALREIA